MLSTSTYKEQFYSKLKLSTIKRLNNRLTSREHLSEQHPQNFNFDDDADAVVAKRIENRIKRNKFMLEFKYFKKKNLKAVAGKYLFSSPSDICQFQQSTRNI